MGWAHVEHDRAGQLTQRRMVPLAEEHPYPLALSLSNVRGRGAADLGDQVSFAA